VNAELVQLPWTWRILYVVPIYTSRIPWQYSVISSCPGLEFLNILLIGTRPRPLLPRRAFRVLFLFCCPVWDHLGISVLYFQGNHHVSCCIFTACSYPIVDGYVLAHLLAHRYPSIMLFLPRAIVHLLNVPIM
jgi:hypothetical protein